MPQKDSKFLTPQQQEEIAQLGWAVKFNFVVGIIHTNYDAYVRQYGLGTAFLAAGALHALSAMVTRAYCHRVIRLSDTLPSLDRSKEVTCNVHGVRVEFLDSPQPNRQANNDDEDKDDDDSSLAAIYFIGKLIWAKGFDKLLDIEELYKKQTGSYFAIDVYGSGPDERPIKRAFWGRKGVLGGDAALDAAQSVVASPQGSGDRTPDRMARGFFETAGSLRDQILAKVGSAADALSPKSKEKMKLSVDDGNHGTTDSPPSPEVLQEPIEVVWNDTVTTISPSTPSRSLTASPTNADFEPQIFNTGDGGGNSLLETEFPNPFVILSDLSGQFIGCGSMTTMAGAKVGSDIVGLGMTAIASTGSTSSSSSDEEEGSLSESAANNDDEVDEGDTTNIEKGKSTAEGDISAESKETMEESDKKLTTDQEDAPAATDEMKTSKDASEDNAVDDRKMKHHKKHREKRGLRFDPIKSRYELRRHPAPARFLGMADHAILRDMTRHKIFFNPSESEVLCTTSAEALAMGKFVILPKHPSNTFFEQFSNCLAYETKEDCVSMIQWALENDPEPLSDEERFQLTWEGANERLYKAAAMTEAEVQQWHDSGRAQSDKDAARLHYETVKRGRGVQMLLHRATTS